MKELIRVRVQYASRQHCCKAHKRPLPFIRSSLFWDVTQRRLVVTDVSGQTVGPIVNGQAKVAFTQRRKPEMKRCFFPLNFVCVSLRPRNEVLVQKWLLNSLIDKQFVYCGVGRNF